MPDDALPLPRAGICATCVHARVVPSDRGAMFLLCGYSAVDRSFAKYPHLPVIACPAHEARPAIDPAC